MSACLLRESPPAKKRRWKILLVSVNRCTTPEPVFPLGLAHLSSALREAGHDVEWMDLLCDPGQFAERLAASNADLVGISIRNIDDVIIRRRETFVDGLPAMVETIHGALRCPVVLGGSGFSILPRELLEGSGADFGVVGEGEVALPTLIEAFERKADFSGIPGLVFKRANQVEFNERNVAFMRATAPAAEVPSQLAAHYLKKGGVLNVQTQRGCAHRCCYCTYPLIEGTRHRRRDPEAVAAEFRQIEKLGARYAFVVDSVFNSSEAHVNAVCEALVRSGSKIRWGCFLRPQGLSAGSIRLMARAGLAHIEFGSDSFCDEVLESYEKNLTFADILRSSDLAREAEIDVCHFVIAGGPGETPKTLAAGFKNSRLLGTPIIMAVPGMRIYPGTRLFERAVKEGQAAPSLNLLEPTYYIAPGFTLERLLGTLQEFRSISPNWIVGDFDPAYESLVARLRQRGVTGPLWSYFATAQRLWPEKQLPKTRG